MALGIAVIKGIHDRVAAAQGLVALAEDASITSVRVVNPIAGGKKQAIELPGNAQAFTDTPIYARTSGYIKKWHVDIGSRVKRGALLAEIEAVELDREVEEAKADLKNSGAVKEIAEITTKRWQNLRKTGAVSDQEADQFLSDFTSKRALFDAATAKVRRLEQLQSYERIVAPVDGIITARNTDIGALIQAGDNASSKELFHLAAIETLRIFITVPEMFASGVRVGDKLDVKFDAFPSETFHGTLVRHANAIDASSHTVRAEVDVDNQAGKLMPGAFAFVHFNLQPSTGAVLIPSNALLFRAEGLRAGVVRDGHVKLLPIVIGRDFGDTVEVISGLQNEDSVVLNPSDSLLEGASVRVEVPSTPSTHS